MVLSQDDTWWRCYDSTWGRDEPNPGFGDTRFAPFDDAETSQRVPTLYFARTAEGALLESVFHSAHPNDGLVYEDTLRNHNLIRARVPRDLNVIDLRDPALNVLDVPRSAVSSSDEEHYPCTRRIARQFHSTPGADGLVWHSRQAEFHAAAGRDVQPSEVLIVFNDHARLRRGSWTPMGAGAVGLLTGPGRTYVDQVAEALQVVVVPG